MNKKTLFFFSVLLVFVLALVLRTGSRDEQDSATVSDSPLDSAYDYYMTNMELDRFNPDGSHSYRINAARVTHFPEGDISILDQPAMNWNQADDAPWELAAETGVLRPDLVRGEEILILQNNVLASTLHPREGKLSIKTESLDVMPGSRELYTRNEVMLQGNAFQVQSKGLHALLAQDKFNLLNEVRGRHEQAATN